jgi:hypothetical protein
MLTNMYVNEELDWTTGRGLTDGTAEILGLKEGHFSAGGLFSLSSQGADPLCVL